MDPAELGGSDNDGEPAQQASGDDEASVAADTISLGDDAEGEEEAEDWWECHVADDPPPCGNDDTQPWPENEAGPSCNQPAAPNVSVYSSDLEVGSLDTSNVTMRKRKLDTLMVDGDGGFPHKKMLGVGDSSSSPASSDSESDSGDDSGGDEEEEGSVLMGLKRKNMAASVPLGKMKVQNSTIPSKSNPPAVMTDWLHTFQQWSNAERLLAIDRLIDSCEPTQVRHMMQVIEPQFQRDFISLLPREEPNQVAGMDEEDAVFSLTGDEGTCICGNLKCKNHQDVGDLSKQPDEHQRLHEALKTLDCATVCGLLRSGMKLCCLGEENCFTLIVQHWTPTILNSALSFYPSAINCRGPQGETLLMLCDTSEKFQTVLDHGADVNATNDVGENFLLYYVKHRLSQQVEEICKHFSIEDSVILCNIKVRDVVAKSKALMRAILNSGVNLDAEDHEGQTALHCILQLFKPGYVIKQYFCSSHGEIVGHDTEMCYYENEIASSVLSVLLQAGAKLPAPDHHGRTPLMLAVQSSWNFENMKTLIERGVDINAQDLNGNNAIFYLLASIVQHNMIAGFISYCDLKFNVVDQMVSFLLDHGCHMQGTDLVTHKYNIKYKVVNHLMALKESTLRERNFKQKQELKNDPINLSFLSLYLKNREEDGFESSDVAFLEHEIAIGLDVNCGAHGYVLNSDEAECWKKNLSLPFPLLCTMNAKLEYFAFYIDPENDEDLDGTIKVAQRKYQVLEDIMKLLLPFWPHPPLALLLFEEPPVTRRWYIDQEAEFNCEAKIMLLKRLIQFLYEVGGPLAPGSEIYCAVKKRLESNAETHPARGECLSLFNQLHYSNVPTLFQLSRTSLRSSLKKTDTKGLDVSSLRAMCQGEMRPLPPDIVDLINFKKSSVSVIKVVPEMINQIEL